MGATNKQKKYNHLFCYIIISQVNQGYVFIDLLTIGSRRSDSTAGLLLQLVFFCSTSTVGSVLVFYKTDDCDITKHNTSHVFVELLT